MKYHLAFWWSTEALQKHIKRCFHNQGMQFSSCQFKQTKIREVVSFKVLVVSHIRRHIKTPMWEANARALVSGDGDSLSASPLQLQILHSDLPSARTPSQVWTDSDPQCTTIIRMPPKMYHFFKTYISASLKLNPCSRNCLLCYCCTVCLSLGLGRKSSSLDL